MKKGVSFFIIEKIKVLSNVNLFQKNAIESSCLLFNDKYPKTEEECNQLDEINP